MELNLKDRKILTELEMNARITHSELGKKVQLSKQVVKYRIKRLEKENIIQGYNALIDVNAFKETIYLVYIKSSKISSTSEKKWMKKIDQHSKVLAVAKNAGHWDMSIVIRAKNNQEFDNIFKEISLGKRENIKEKLVTSEIHSSYFNTKIFYNGKTIERSTSDFKDTIKIDEKDKKLIHLLSDNCRLSLIELAGKLKMSANGVKERIKKLEKNKIIIAYKTKINYEKLGYLHFRVFLHINKFETVLYNKIKNFLKAKKNIESVSRYMGHADIDFRCHVKTILELYQLISDIKDNFLQNIVEVDSMPIFAWEKIGYYSK